MNMYSPGFFICVLLMCTSLSNTLKCNTEQRNDTAKVECTATYYKKENCSESFLSKIYTHLYGKDDFPDRPSAFTLQPIQEKYGSTLRYYSGFIAAVKPPRSYDIVAVKGFQIDYSDDQDGLRCIVLEIINTTLSSIHIQNDLRLTVKIYPLTPNQDFAFTAFSLPTPRSEKEVQQRYGKSGNYGWDLSSGSASWRTTLSFNVNTDERYIEVWYAPAPKVFNFTSYEVTLSRILNQEGMPEIRATSSPVLIQQLEYKYSNLAPGKYRVGILPNDDGIYPDCKCANALNICRQCTRIVTKIIDIQGPDEVQSRIFQSTTKSVKAQYNTSKPTIRISSSTKTLDGTKQNIIATINQLQDEDPDIVLPSVLSVLALILVVLVIGVCYMLNRNRIRRLFDDKPDVPVKYMCNNHGDTPIVNKDTILHSHKDHEKPIATEIKVAIVSADDDDYHRKVVEAFAMYLQKH